MSFYYNNLIITRISPFPGHVLVEIGDDVEPDTTILRTESTISRPFFFNVAQRFEISPAEIEKYVFKKVGEEVEAGEIFAKYRRHLTMRQIESPINGIVEKIDTKTGYVLLREKVKNIELPTVLDLSESLKENKVKNMSDYLRVEEGDWVEYRQVIAGIQPIPGLPFYQNSILTPCAGKVTKIDYENLKVIIEPRISLINLKALYWGKVCEIIPSYGAKLKFSGFILPCSYGVGGVAYGKLGKVIASEDEEILFIEYLDSRDAWSIIQKRPRGLILGSTDYETIEILRQANITSVVIENFGIRNLDNEYRDFLKRCINRNIIINGTTILRAGVVRPQVLIPGMRDEMGTGRTQSSNCKVIWGAYYGKKGKVINTYFAKTPCGIETWMCTLLCEDGKEIAVPMSNMSYL